MTKGCIMCGLDRIYPFNRHGIALSLSTKMIREWEVTNPKLNFLVSCEESVL